MPSDRHMPAADHHQVLHQIRMKALAQIQKQIFLLGPVRQLRITAPNALISSIGIKAISRLSCHRTRCICFQHRVSRRDRRLFCRPSAMPTNTRATLPDLDLAGASLSSCN